MKSQSLLRAVVRRLFLVVSLAAVSVGYGMAQDQTGPILDLGFGGSSGSYGQVYRLYDAVGYRFSKHFEVAAGLPVYFVKASDAGLAQGFSSNNGIGNAFLLLRGIAGGGDWYFSSTIKATAPTGNSDRGFSTGRATVDWTNYLEKTSGRFTPFGIAGIANSISDTRFFIRPFTSLGFIGHFEGGVDVEVVGPISLGGSFYADVPSGQQKVFSKLLPRAPSSAMPGRGAGHGRPFENQSAAVGGTETDKDHGASAWVDFNPGSTVGFEAGYSRSMQYDLDTFFFLIAFDLRGLVKKSIR